MHAATLPDLAATRVRVAVPPRDEAGVAALLHRLDAAECTAVARFHFFEDRASSAAAHALLRSELTAVAASLGVRLEPAHWRFERGSHGKPALAQGQLRVPLEFSLSHTRGLVAVALRVGAPIGVDVERHARLLHDGEALARQCFTPRERQWLAGAPGEAAWQARFFQLWTAKEAYIKGLGLGLSHPLQAFSAEPPQGSYLLEGAETERDPRWRLRQWEVSGFAVALAEQGPWAGEPAFESA